MKSHKQTSTKVSVKTHPIPIKKLKVAWNSDPLMEAKMIGYMEGFSDGRIDLKNELVELKLLKGNWKKKFNHKHKDDGYMFK